MNGAQHELARGWRQIVACAVGVGVGTTGMPFYTFGVFVKPLAATMGWDRGEVTLGLLLLNLGVMITSPFIGRVVDRIGVHRIALASLVGLALGFALVSRTGPGIGGFYAAWIVLALLGAATTPLTWTRVINLGFDRARGLALGLTLLGTGIASVAGPPLVQMLIAHYGWRGGYLGMALFVLVVVVPLVWAFLREPATAAHPVTAAPLPGHSFREAIASRHFVLIGVAIFCVILAQAGTTVHLVPLLTDRGFTPARATGIAALLGLAVIIGRIGVGLLLDRFHAPNVARVFLALPALSLALLLFSHSLPAAIGAVLLLGLAAGAEVDLLAYLVSRYFGMRSYGAIYGTLLSVFALGGGLGPVLAGRTFDAFKSYDPALACGIVLFLAGGTTIGFLKAYPQWHLAA